MLFRSVCTGYISLERLIELMSTNPAKILGLPLGRIEEGAEADFMLFDPAESFKVVPEKLHSKSKNTPFKGIILNGQVKYTIMGGKLCHSID